MFPKRAPLEGWLRVGNGSESFAGNDNPKLSLDGRFDLAWGRANIWSPRAERLALSTAASDVTPGGATSGALRWWYNRSLALGASGYLMSYDVAPLETPGRNNSWLALARHLLSSLMPRLALRDRVR